MPLSGWSNPKQTHSPYGHMDDGTHSNPYYYRDKGGFKAMLPHRSVSAPIFRQLEQVWHRAAGLSCVSPFLLDGKDTNMEFKESISRTSKFNSNRTSYLSSDGKYYCYEHWDYQSECYVTEKIEIGKDISPEIARYLDKSDHDMDLNDRYQHALLGKSYETESQHSYSEGEGNKHKKNTSERFLIDNDSPENILFAEEKPESPQTKTVRTVISEQFTEKQKNFFYDHFGMQKTLEEMRKAEHKLTGILPSAAAMTNRKNKIIDKTAKALRVERVKRHKYPKK